MAKHPDVHFEARASVDTVSFNIVLWQQAVAGVVLLFG